MLLFCWLKHANLQVFINKDIHLLHVFYLNFVFYSVFIENKRKSVLFYGAVLYDHNI